MLFITYYLHVTFDDIESSSKSLTYKHYKSAIEPESYHYHTYKSACCFSHVRMIEKWGHLGIHREYWFCAYCYRSSVYVIDMKFIFLLRVLCRITYGRNTLDTDVTEQ